MADSIQKQRSASMNDFEVVHDSDSNTWHVVGAGIQRFVQMTNWQYVLSFLIPVPSFLNAGYKSSLCLFLILVVISYCKLHVSFINN